MTTNQTIDGVPRELLERVATEANHMLGFTSASNYDECRNAVDELRALLDAPDDKATGHCSDWLNCCCGGDTQRVREGCANWVSWKKPDAPESSVCAKSQVEPAAQPQPAPVIDLDAVDWETIQKAADESSWMPNEYMRNDWVSDVCNFLKYGRAEQPAPVAVARLNGMKP